MAQSTPASYVLGMNLEQWFSIWGRDPQRGREPFFESSSIDILCIGLLLYYICFIQV